MKILHSTLLALVVTFTGCGGGGGDGPSGPAVTEAATSTPKYGAALLFTLSGSSLDQGINLASAGCRDITLGTTAPNVSNATVAYFRCTVTGVGAQTATVTRRSDGTVLGTVNYTVPEPQVTLTVSNGTGAGAVNGDVVLTLKPVQAPKTVDNFLAYVNSGFFDGTVFHRHSPGFVLQGGGFAVGLNPTQAVPAPKPTNPPIELEAGRGLSNLRLTVAMARTSELNSATSQFFINLVDNAFLDSASGGYAVFGAVTAGEAVVTAMTAAFCTVYPALLPSTDCLPLPNLAIMAARQTR